MHINALCTYNNNKDRFNTTRQKLRQAKEEAYRNGDHDLYKEARNTLMREIRAAKRSYA